MRQARLLTTSDTEQGILGSLSHAIHTDEFDTFWMAVAWVSLGGLGRLEPIIARLDRSPASAIVGIDRGGTSAEALQECFTMFGEVHVFHDPAKLFHPKTYVLESSAKSERSFGIVGCSGHRICFRSQRHARPARFSLRTAWREGAMSQTR